VQDLLEPLRWKSPDAFSEEGAIDTDDLRTDTTVAIRLRFKWFP